MTFGHIDADDILALMELAQRAPKTQTEQRWLVLFAQKLDYVQRASEEEKRRTTSEEPVSHP